MGNMAKYMAMRGAGGSDGGMRYEMNGGNMRYAMGTGDMRYAMGGGDMRGGAYGRMGEQEYERGYEEPENRRRDSRGRFRSEMEMSPGMGMNTIGFSAHTGPQSKQRDIHLMRGTAAGMKFNEQMAQQWMERLQREDDTEGPVWSIGQIKQAMEQRGIKEDPMRMWVAVNAVYADFCDVAKKYGVNDFEFFLDLGKAFLDDKDAKGDKLLAYFENIVK